jgi:hypothetical protein
MALSKEQQAKVLDALKVHGTYVAAAKAINIHTAALYQERKRNKNFGALCNTAIEEGKASVGDKALSIIQDIAFGPSAKDQQRLTAALALANAFIPGFRGISKTEGHIQHDIKVITSIPRPQYKDTPAIEGEYKQLPSPEDPRKEKHRAHMREYMRNKRARGKDKNSNV